MMVKHSEKEQKVNGTETPEVGKHKEKNTKNKVNW